MVCVHPFSLLGSWDAWVRILSTPEDNLKLKNKYLSIYLIIQYMDVYLLTTSQEIPAGVHTCQLPGDIDYKNDIRSMKTSDKPLCGSICNRWGWFCQLCPWLHSLFFYFINTKENVIYFMRVSHMIGWISHMIAHFVSIYQFICVLIQMTGLWLGLKSSCPFNLTNIIVIEHTVTSNQRRRHPDWLFNSLFRPTTKQTPKLPPPPPPPMQTRRQFD